MHLACKFSDRPESFYCYSHFHSLHLNALNISYLFSLLFSWSSLSRSFTLETRFFHAHTDKPGTLKNLFWYPQHLGLRLNPVIRREYWDLCSQVRKHPVLKRIFRPFAIKWIFSIQSIFHTINYNFEYFVKFSTYPIIHRPFLTEKLHRFEKIMEFCLRIIRMKIRFVVIERSPEPKFYMNC